MYKRQTLWSSKGSSYKRGNLFVIPIESSLLYVEPVYLEAEKSAIPEVKRVIVVYDDKIAYEPTLGEALNALFGEGTSGEGEKPQTSEGGSENQTESTADLIEKASKAYDNAQAALKDGDWAKYGEYMEELEAALKKLS